MTDNSITAEIEVACEPSGPITPKAGDPGHHHHPHHLGAHWSPVEFPDARTPRAQKGGTPA
jgi:hypothetical protein